MIKTCDAKAEFSTLTRLGTFVGLLFLFYAPVLGQGGNSVSGHVFGSDRRPLADVYVELLDDLNRTINRTRTNASGRYFFYGLSAGRFIVRVMPLSTDYQEQEQDLEINNFARTTSTGELRSFGHEAAQRDFYLTPRKRALGLAAPATVFAQDVPDKAKALYNTALDDLGNKKTKEAYESLKAAIEIFPKYFLALETLGVEYVKAGHFPAAQVLLTIAVDVNPRAYKSWYGLARSLAAQKKNEEALAAAEKALEINRNSSESLFLSGALLRQAKNYTEAEKRLKKADELSGGTIPDVHWELALLYANGMKRYKDAARELKLYLKAVPDRKDAETVKKLIAEFESKAKTT